MGIFYKEFALKKVLECGVAKSWEKIKVGDTVQLTLNLEDYNLTGFKKQVGVLFVKEEVKNDQVIVEEKIEKIIGIIPEEEGKFIKDFLDMGWDDEILFSAIISQNDDAKPLENRFKVAVYIERFIDVKEKLKKKI